MQVQEVYLALHVGLAEGRGGGGVEDKGSDCQTRWLSTIIIISESHSQLLVLR